VENPDSFDLKKFLTREAVGISDTSLNEFKRMIDFLNETENGQNLLSADRIFLEKSVLFRIPGIDTIFRAIPDAIWLSGNQCGIIDYKSGMFHDESDRRGFSYAEQIRAYALASKAVYSVDVSDACLIYVDSEKILDIDTGTESLNKTIGNMQKFVESVSSGSFEPKPGKLCEYCNFSINCPVAHNDS